MRGPVCINLMKVYVKRYSAWKRGVGLSGGEYEGGFAFGWTGDVIWITSKIECVLAKMT